MKIFVGRPFVQSFHSKLTLLKLKMIVLIIKPCFLKAKFLFETST